MVQARMPRAYSAWRGKLLSRVAVVAVAVVVSLLSSIFAVSRLPASAVVIVESRKPRVLLLGDSVMDQQGSHAAFELDQAGVETKTVGLWGSSLLTRDQYDYGKTKVNGGWLKEATKAIAAFDPDLVAVYLNHNYWPPYPRDAAGKVISGGNGSDALWSRAGQAMLHAQTTALITILRARGARVFFVAPIPTGRNHNPNPDPNAWSPIWHGYLSVLTKMHVPIIDSSTPLQASNGLRAETKPSCTGAKVRVRPVDDLHLTRYGAALAGTALAKSLARIVGVSLDGNGAPGDHTAALVPTPDGRGYWLVGCEGSVFDFGTAAHLPGARVAIAGHRGVVAAAATPDGKGMWLVAADGTIASVGTAAPMTFRVKPASAIAGATATPDGTGIVATTIAGSVHTAGTARSYGSLAGRHLNGAVVDIESTRDGKGYWLVGADGGVFGFGNARYYGATGHTSLAHPIVGMAATPDDRGYWQVSSDGSIFAFGDAKDLGNARWTKPGFPFVGATPGPSVDVVAAPGAKQGYWVVGDTGRVINAGGARGHEGDNGLALFTQ